MPKFIEWIDTRMEEAQQNPKEAASRDAVQEICEAVVCQTKAWGESQARLPLNGRKSNPAITQEIIERVITATAKLGNIELLQKVLQIWPACPTNDMVMEVAAFIILHDSTDLLPV